MIKKLFVLMSLFTLAMPAMAAKFEIGGRARAVWSYTFNDEDAGDNTDFLFSEPASGSAILKLKIKTSDSISGCAELGYTNTDSSETTKFRKLYATWRFRSGELTVGRDSGPANAIIFNSVLNDEDPMYHHGQFYTQHHNLLRLILDKLVIPGQLEMALMDNKGISDNSGTSTAGYTVDDSKFPKIEVAYDFTAGPVWLKPFMGFQFSKGKDPATDATQAVNAYVLGSFFKVTIDRAWVGGDMYFAQNPGNYGVYLFESGPVDWPIHSTATFDGNAIEDAMAFAGAIGGGLKFNDLLGVEGGLGYQKVELDVANKIEDDQFSWYLQVPVSPAKGVMIIPEIGQIVRGDYKVGNTETAEGISTYLAAMFQISF